ncbi:MAG: bifunctional diguanylate cyclase/phosphodiesterase [Gammaproteobacteria bacterium]|nr:bifunctional diguanylate cyclase/phosphodiesterase [Gammaproteobacteria bacterium]
MSLRQPEFTKRIEDSLTRLHNRESFFNLLQQRVVESALNNAPIALLIIDISAFHRINLIHGYQTGDALLYQFATLLEKVRRPQDHCARIGDDQFALILRNIMNQGHARLAAMKVLKLLEKPMEVKDKQFTLNVHIGAALCPEDASESNHLLKSAERALLIAKKSGNLIEFNCLAHEEEINENWGIEVELEDAIDKSQLVTYYQAKISLESGRPMGAEALIRWNSPNRGFVSPDVFIPIAESMGFIKPMTNWLLNNVLRQSQSWSNRWGVLTVSINVPPQLLLEPDFFDMIRSALKLWPSKHIQLCLEIIERSFVSDTEHCFSLLNELRALGVKISIDDFGTGYSSLSYFKSIPADELKIDKSFLANIPEDIDNVNLIRLIIHLAHSFNMHVVAEGVEDIKTAATLRKLACDQVQGYLFSKPLPQAEFIKFLENYRGLPK